MFNTDEDEIKVAIATLMCNIAHADNRITDLEKDNIYSFFQNEFNLSIKETQELFAPILKQTAELDSQVGIIVASLENNINLKALLMKHLNNLIICDGCEDIEYRVFDEIKSRLL